MKIGFWKTKKGFVSHKNGLNEEQVQYLSNLKVGDRLVIFLNDVREGEKGAHATLLRNTLATEVKENAESVGK